MTKPEKPTLEELHSRIADVVMSNYKKEDVSIDKIHLEPPGGLAYCCVNIPKKYLLSFKDDEEFIRACYLKILDRVVDEQALDQLTMKLKDSSISREEIIENLLNSRELVNAKRTVKMG